MPRMTRRQRLACELIRQGFTPAQVRISLERFRPMSEPSKPRLGPNRSQWRRMVAWLDEPYRSESGHIVHGIMWERG